MHQPAYSSDKKLVQHWTRNHHLVAIVDLGFTKNLFVQVLNLCWNLSSQESTVHCWLQNRKEICVFVCICVDVCVRASKSLCRVSACVVSGKKSLSPLDLGMTISHEQMLCRGVTESCILNQCFENHFSLDFYNNYFSYNYSTMVTINSLFSYINKLCVIQCTTFDKWIIARFF